MAMSFDVLKIHQMIAVKQSINFITHLFNPHPDVLEYVKQELLKNL